MANGKGSNPRKFTKNGHRRVLENWEDSYPERKPLRPGKTVYVWKDGELVDKETLKPQFISIPPVDYSEYDRFSQYCQNRILSAMGVPRKKIRP